MGVIPIRKSIFIMRSPPPELVQSPFDSLLIPALSHSSCQWHFDYLLHVIWSKEIRLIKKWYSHLTDTSHQLHSTSHYLLQTPHYWILTTNWLAIFCFTLHLLRLKSNNFFIETSHQDNCFQSNQMCKYAGQDWVCCTNWNTQDKISASWFSRANCCSQSVYTSLAWTIKLFFKNSINLNILITSYEAIMTFIDVFRKGFCT